MIFHKGHPKNISLLCERKRNFVSVSTFLRENQPKRNYFLSSRDNRFAPIELTLHVIRFIYRIEYCIRVDYSVHIIFVK